MIERTAKRSIHCPVCGRYLLKAKDGSDIEVTCDKCNSEIIAKVTDGMVAASEDRRGKLPTRSGEVSISVSKSGKKNNSMREAAYA